MQLVQQLLTLVVPIIILWLIVWLLGFLPLPEPAPRIIRVIAIILTVLYLLSELFGVRILNFG